MLTGCPTPITPTPEDTPVYPETLTTADMATIASFDVENATFQELLTMMNQVITILNNQTQTDEVSSYKATLNNIKSMIENANISIISETVEKDIKDIKEAKKTDNNYSNYSDYESAYALYETAYGLYSNYFDEDYTTAFNAYKTKLDALKTTHPSYDSLVEFMKTVVNDFKDNYVFNNTYDETSIQAKVDAAKTEQDSISDEKTTFETTQTELNNKKSTKDTSLTNANSITLTQEQDGTGTELTTKSFNFSDVLVTRIVDEDDSNNVTFTVNAEKVANFAGKDVTITLPYGDDTSVNISELLALKNYLISDDNDDSNDASTVTIDKTNYETTTFISDANVGLSVDKIKEFKDLALDLSVESDKLPTISLHVGYISNGEIYNLYGTELDKIIEKYFSDNIAIDKLTYKMHSSSVVVFDAKEYLNGGSMYDANNNFNDTAYELDVNAALLMGSELKNVNVVGENKTDETNIPSLCNVRIESDLDGLVGFYGYGVIDFAGNAPAETPIATEGKVIIRKIADGTADKGVVLNGIHTLDVSELDSTSLNKINGDINITEIYYGADTASFGDTGTSFGAKYQNGSVIKQTSGYTPLRATNQDWEATGNDVNHTIPTARDENGNLISKAQPNIKKSILKKLLDDNQKVYG